MLARYILCYNPVFVRPSVWLAAEGPRDAKSCRVTRVETSSFMRPIATDANRNSSVVGPYMRLIATGAQPWHGDCVV